jgi:hypothetical protein
LPVGDVRVRITSSMGQRSEISRSRRRRNSPRPSVRGAYRKRNRAALGCLICSSAGICGADHFGCLLVASSGMGPKSAMNATVLRERTCA